MAAPTPPPPLLTRLRTDVVTLPEEHAGEGVAPHPLGAGAGARGGHHAGHPSLGKQATTVDPHGQAERETELPRGPLSADRLHAMTKVGAPVPCPFGRWIVFSAREIADANLPFSDGDEESKGAKKNNAFYSRLYIVDGDSGEMRRLTSPSEPRFKDYEPAWLDAETVVFLSTRSGLPQIWSINVNGGEAEQLSRFPVPIDNLKVYPHASALLFTARVYVSGAGANPLSETAARDKVHSERTAKYHKFTKLMVRHWDSVKDEKRSHVFLQPYRVRLGGLPGYELDPRFAPQDLMAGVDADCPVGPFGGAEHFDLARAGDEFAYTAHAFAHESAEAWTTDTNVYAVRLVPLGETDDTPVSKFTLENRRCLTPHNHGYDQSPLYSADGRFIAYLSMARAGYESDRNRIMLYDRDRDRSTELAAKWDFSAAALAWQDDSTLLVNAQSRGHNAVFTLAVDGKSEPRVVLDKHNNAHMLPLSRDRVVFTRSDFCSPDEIFRCRLDGTDVQQLTALNRRRVEALQLGRVEDLTFAGAGGDPVQAWFLHPAGFDPHGKAKAPLAVVIHGGPQGAVLDSWHYRWNAQFLASHGFATLCVNFHGSTGFGQAFTDAINGDWGGKPFEDVMLGVDFALQRYPWLDRDRVGALGASYGGFLINWINGHTDRFKCLVNHDGLFNQEAMYFATEELFFPEFEFRGQPWNSELFRKFSPHCHVEKWKTPTLVIHGGKDFRVPETEGLSTFSALQRRGVPSAFLYFPDENHWVLNPSNSIVWHREVLAWLRRFLVV